MLRGRISMTPVDNITTQKTDNKAVLAFFGWCAVVIFEVLLSATVLVSPFSLLFIFALVAMLLLILKPEYAVYSMAIFLFTAPCLHFFLGDLTPMSGAHLSTIFGFIFWIFAVLRRTRPLYPWTKIDIPLIFFVGWALLSLLWSHNSTAGFEDATKLCLAIAAFVLIVSLVRTKKRLQVVLGITLLMGLINACLAIYYPYTTFTFIREWPLHDLFSVKTTFWSKNITIPYGRSSGFGTPHNTGAIMAFPITFAMMYFFVTKNVKRRWALMFVALVFFAGSIATLSKGPLISLIIGTIFVLLHLKPLKRKFFTTLAIIGIITIVSFGITRIKGIGMATSTVATSMTTSSDPERMTSLENRIICWKIGGQKLWDTAGIGTGIGGTNQYFPFKWIDGAHPVTLFDLGFLGFIFYWWLLIAAFYFFWTTLKESRNEYFRRMLIVYIGGYITILVSWIVSFSYIHLYLYFYLGIGFAVAHLAQKSPPEPHVQLPFSDVKGGSIVDV